MNATIYARYSDSSQRDESIGGKSMKYDEKLRAQVKDLTLLLLYLNSFDDGGYRRSWKGYDFDDLNELAEEGFISEGRRAKSVVVYDEGIEKVHTLCEKYGIRLL